MDKFNQALKEANANSSIDQTPLNQNEVDIINQAILNAKITGKSFFTSLYELTEQVTDENQRDKSK